MFGLKNQIGANMNNNYGMNIFFEVFLVFIICIAAGIVVHNVNKQYFNN